MSTCKDDWNRLLTVGMSWLSNLGHICHNRHRKPSVVVDRYTPAQKAASESDLLWWIWNIG